MSEVGAALLGSLIGAIAGLAGGGFAALASLRASQISARSSLGDLIHDVADALVSLDQATSERALLAARNELGSRTNRLPVHQTLLAPSRVLSQVLVVTQQFISASHWDRVTLHRGAGALHFAISDLLAVQSQHILGFRAHDAQILALQRFLLVRADLPVPVRMQLEKVAWPALC